VNLETKKKKMEEITDDSMQLSHYTMWQEAKESDTFCDQKEKRRGGKL